MTAPKLTRRQRALLENVRQGFTRYSGRSSASVVDEYRELERAGLVRTHLASIGEIDEHTRVFLTDAGRAALEELSSP